MTWIKDKIQINDRGLCTKVSTIRRVDCTCTYSHYWQYVALKLAKLLPIYKVWSYFHHKKHYCLYIYCTLSTAVFGITWSHLLALKSQCMIVDASRMKALKCNPLPLLWTSKRRFWCMLSVLLDHPVCYEPVLTWGCNLPGIHTIVT